MTKFLNVYVARDVTRKKNKAAHPSRVAMMAQTILRRQGVTADLTIRRETGGKPVFVRYPKCFNGSHSGEFIVCVFDDAPVGIDVQQIDTRRDLTHYQKIAGRFFHEKEFERLRSLPRVQQREAFFALWSQKEAVMKQTGRGFALPMNAFYVDASGDVYGDDGHRWAVTLVPFSVQADYVGYVCIKSNLENENRAHKKDTSPSNVKIVIREVSL